MVVNGQNVGLIVDVLSAHPVFELCWSVRAHGHADGTLFKIKPGQVIGCDDFRLKPIRDNDGEDETLQWAPVPVKEIA